MLGQEKSGNPGPTNLVEFFQGPML
jgi:hypothetical protein